MDLGEMRERCGYSPTPGLAGQLDGDTPPRVTFALLSDLLEWAVDEPRLTALYLDVKLEPRQAGEGPLLADALARALDRRPFAVTLLLPKRELWEAFSATRWPEACHVVPDFERPNVLRDVVALGARRVSMGFTRRRTWGDFLHELAEVVAARDAGALEAVTVWTLNDEEQLRAVLDAGVDAILTDDIPLLLRLIDARRRPSAR
jgi:glycerophosphoryl diester phosphodiesterase